ncbi:MAG: hypothetical protein O2985_10765 [Proteobacteria bacterium]|nr:hypothetical protein [Pseudomonadota bacterium]
MFKFVTTAPGVVIGADTETAVGNLRTAVDTLPPSTRYTVEVVSVEKLKITAVVSAEASATINLAAFKNAVVTKLSDGVDAGPSRSNIASPGLTGLKNDADRILREYQIRIETLQKLSVPAKTS